jgi:SNF2 family DNA or RNA helicase
MKAKLLILIFFNLILLNSCVSVKLLPEYSESLETEIIQTQKQNEKLYLELIELPEEDRTYANISKQYLEIESSINSILFQYQSRQKSEEFVKMAQLLKDNFKQYKTEHKDKKTLNTAEINLYISYINSFWQPILTAEKALKNIKTN